MPVLKNDIVTVTNVAPGTRTTPTFNLPADVYEVSLALSRDDWPVPSDGGDLVKGLIDFSKDNGQTWSTRGGFSAAGGVIPDDPEVPPAAQGTWIGVAVEDVGSSHRRIRATITNTAKFSTTVSIITRS